MSLNFAAARKALLTTCAAIALSGGITHVYAQNDRVQNYAIEQQRLGDALRQFAVVSGRDLSFTPELVRGKTARGVRGSFSEIEALKILLDGTDLEFDQNTMGVIVLHKKVGLMKTADTLAAPPPVRATQAAAAQASSAATTPESSVEEVVVTGSRIVREGYEAPTPLTVISADALASSADSNLINFLNTMPAISGSQTAASGSTAVANGTAGIQALNLRSLGANRVLVLLDGQRTAGASYQGIVDVGSFPQQLISRVDVVTGGASAVYGSDAVAGVVNFILDKKYTGVKGELSGGLTNYGDDKNYKVDLSAGFGFADDRGHVLLSGEQMHNQGITGDGGRQWNRDGFQQLANPNYTATNGQPSQLVLTQVGGSISYPPGLIISGPLKGTAFGEGGTPFQFQYGPIISGTAMQGGDWKLTDLRPYADMDPHQTSQSLFARVSYDVTDNINAFVQYGWTQNNLYNVFGAVTIVPGSIGTVQIDNAYLPASVRAAMVANNVTSFQMVGGGADFPWFGNYNTRKSYRVDTGLEGTFNAFDISWHWNASYGYSATKNSIHSPVAPNVSRVILARDAVVNPTNGQIVCRSTLTDPTNGCKPWDVMGIGVNAGNVAALDWMNGDGSSQEGLIEEATYATSVTGEPFSLWAGPVSLAVSFEHRADKEHAVADQLGQNAGHALANFGNIDGQQSVTEGALETVIPLAKDESWAKNWDFTAAARFTGYELAGYVTTYKFGTTYTPIDDIKFRVTRSRDIRAPNLQELFAERQFSASPNTVLDRFNNSAPVNPQFAIVFGNPNLVPEVANTTGIGVVLAPRFLDGFTASVDFWDVDIHGAIQQLTAQQVIDSCFSGQFSALCSGIVRDPTTGLITAIETPWVNLAVQDVRGIDFETSYRAPMSSIASDWRGDFSLHGLMTVYLRNYQNNTFVPPTNHVGENTSSNPPYWKLTTTATYSLDPVSASLTVRAVSAGRINSEYIECTSGCPAATPAHPTININHMAGAAYMDANVNYKLDLGESTTGELFFSVRNMFSKDPTLAVGFAYSNTNSNAILYDSFGAVYRAGIRFKM